LHQLAAVDDKTAVLGQLERMLGSSAFRNSRRHSTLLRHLVERTLAGSSSDLKERTLGVEVFGRPTDYDNYSDPVVRIAAGEVRKRIAQYYHEPGHERELRIELPLGSYVPEFHDTPARAEPKPQAQPLADAKSAAGRRQAFMVAACAGTLAAALALWRPWAGADVIQQFWRPYLKTGAPVIVCLSRMQTASSGPKMIAWPDSATSARVANLLGRLGEGLELRPGDSVTFQDLRDRPAVLIGAFNDPWSLRLTEKLRFEFQREGAQMWVSDRNNSSSRSWSLAYAGSGSPGRDYAVVSRLLSGRSGTPVLIIAGLGGPGTDAAGDFVTRRQWLDQFRAKAPSGWQNRNLQVVIGTEVIDGHAGPPKIEAIQLW
jgi:hypothetical protein